MLSVARVGPGQWDPYMEERLILCDFPPSSQFPASPACPAVCPFLPTVHPSGLRKPLTQVGVVLGAFIGA